MTPSRPSAPSSAPAPEGPEPDRRGARMRLAPPEAGRELMLRPRLLAALQARFRVRLTTVTAGPGFGKTSLMAQATAENRLAPRGDDVWITCREGDSAASSLAEALFAAFRLPGISSWDPGVVIERVADEIWGRSPQQVALVLDEAHLVTAGSPGAALVSGLLRRLPGNAHLVLVGRDPLPPLGTARLAVQGQLAELHEPDLAFTAEELAAFAALRGVAPETLESTGGWPALAELSASTGGERVIDYLWEELLSQLPPERRHDLAALSLLTPVDDELAVALTGHPVDLTATLADLPLVWGRPGAERSLHPLWRPALAGELGEDEGIKARQRAAAVLRGRGAVNGAVQLLAAARDWDGVRSIASETAMITHPLVAPDVLEQWYRRLPEPERRSPEGALLQALVARAHDLTRALPLFTLAAERFAKAGDVIGEVAACTHVAHIGWWLDDLAAIEAAVGRVARLADSYPWLLGVVALGRAFEADANGRCAYALELLGRIAETPLPERMQPGIDWMWAWEWLLTGRPDRAQRHGADAVDRAEGTFLAPALNVLLLGRWHSGQLAEALDLLPRFVEATVATGRDLGTVFERSQCALLLAFIGRTEQARPHLDAARAALPGASGAATAEISFALAEAAVRIAAGDEAAAGALLEAELAARPLTGDGCTRWHLMFPALTYVLAPGSRAYWDGVDLGPSQSLARDLARALVAVRERGDVRAAARLDLSDAGPVRAQLPLPWIAELAVAALAGGSRTADALLDPLGPELRPWLRRLAAGTSQPARAAKLLLGRQPPTPQSRLDLHVLGPMELRREGAAVDHPDLRRERVRQLLQYLAVRGPVARAAAGAELWPDLPPDGAARNLRVTLTYLQRVLEPDREEGDPPMFLRTEGGMLSLHLGESLRVDLHQFEEELDAAERAERAGAPSLALAHLTRALPWYRGDCLAELSGVAWADLERDRLRVRYVSAATRAGALMLATGDFTTPLDLAQRALRTDPYSEAAYRLLVAAHLERGELDGARQAYRRCLAMLAELDLTPEPRTEVLARRIGMEARPVATGAPGTATGAPGTATGAGEGAAGPGGRGEDGTERTEHDPGQRTPRTPRSRV